MAWLILLHFVMGYIAGFGTMVVFGLFQMAREAGKI